jgi:2-amino-4-hydroxy-6-hydroxymethyldihydropteridine diphosphokinase
MAERVFVGLGSNLGERVEHIRRAIRAMDTLESTRVARCSSLYRTAPVGNVEQPDFINAVCELETGLPPERLLQELLRIESDQGRQRHGPRWSPRTLDLDLLLYGQRQLVTPGLVLPHGRLHERAFVLYPLAELAPELVVPNRGPVNQLLAACRDQRVDRVEGDSVLP